MAHGLKIGNIEFKHALIGGELSQLKKQLAAAFAKSKQLRKQIESDFASGKSPHEAIAGFLISDEARLTCSIEAAKGVGARHRPRLEKCVLVASSLMGKNLLNEASYVHSKKKAGGGYRLVQRFGPRRRAAQQMVLRALEPIFVRRAFQFTYLGIHKPIGL